MIEALRSCRGGVVPPIATPLTERGQIDRDSLRNLRRRLARAGVAGVFALGSTGESSYLTTSDRLDVVTTLAEDDDAPALPLLVGVVETTARRVVEAAGPLLEHRVAALVATGPFYAQASEAEIIDHFEFIAHHCGVPVIAYNIPSNVGYSLSARVMTELLDSGVIGGIKDSSPDLAGLRAVVESDRSRSSLYFTGSDGLLDCALQVGANGAVAGLSNVAPELFVTALAAHGAGDRELLARTQARITGLTRLYTPYGGEGGVNATQLGSIKSALRLQGVISSDQVSVPMRRSTSDRISYVERVLAEADVLDVAR